MFTNNLKNVRIENNITQKKVAELLNMKQQAYSRYELNIFNLSIANYIKLAGFYHTSIDYLVGLTDVKKPYPRLKKDTNK